MARPRALCPRGRGGYSRAAFADFARRYLCADDHVVAANYECHEPSVTRGRTAKRVAVPPWRTVLVSFNRDAVVIDELMPGFGRALRFNFDNLRSLMIYLSARGH